MSTITLKDNATVRDQIKHKMSGGPTRTKIIITDHNTGEVLGEVHNKILVPGSQLTACKQFGLDTLIWFPTYNEELDLDHTLEPEPPEEHVTPENPPITCLWCVGRDGAATSPNEVYIVNNTDRIRPVPRNPEDKSTIIPFRYVDNDPASDLSSDERQIYFGKRTDSVLGKIAYYFKKFDTDPQLHINYIDGTEVTEDMWDTVTNQPVEIYVEMRLSVSRTDLREWFDSAEGPGWDNADISTISLVSAWYTEWEETPGNTFKFYQDILPFSKFNFKPEKLTDLSRAIDFNYQVFY